MSNSYKLHSTRNIGLPVWRKVKHGYKIIVQHEYKNVQRCYHVNAALQHITSALRWGWAVSTTPRPLYPQERPSSHCTGGWVGPRAGLDGCGKSRSHRDSIPPHRPARSVVAIPTELSRPIFSYSILPFP